MSSGTSGAGAVACQQCGASCSAVHKFCAFCGSAIAASNPTQEKVQHRLSFGSRKVALASDLHIVVRRTFLEVEMVGDEQPTPKQRRFTDSFLATKDASVCSTSTSEGSTPSLPSTPSTPRSTPSDIAEVICKPNPLSSYPVESPSQQQQQEPMLQMLPVPYVFGPPSSQWRGVVQQPWVASGHAATYGQKGHVRLETSHAENSQVVCSRAANCTKPSAPRTTVMLRNMPLEYTREMLVDLLNAEGFFGLYNFVYLPTDFCTHSGLGYAFVDLRTASDTACFWKHFDGFSQWGVESDRICTLDWSAQQGLAGHIERYRNSPVMHSSVPEVCRPLLFRNGMRVAFPLPTKPIKAPRLRASK